MSLLQLYHLEKVTNNLNELIKLDNIKLSKKTGVYIVNKIKGNLNRIPLTPELDYLNKPRTWDDLNVDQKKEELLKLYTRFYDTLQGK